MRAIETSWKRSPPPAKREELKFEAMFSSSEAEQLMMGTVPVAMEDKWFIYFEDGWLRFHRSWTGAYIYALQLDESQDGVRVADSWVNRDPEQYQGTDVAYDRKLVRYLIDAVLLKREGVTFPRPTPFTLVVADNFHYRDESKFYEHGAFETLEAAIETARGIVDSFLSSALKPGITAEQLYEHYVHFGEDPFIRGATGGNPFSAWKYAKQRCSEMCSPLGGSRANAPELPVSIVAVGTAEGMKHYVVLKPPGHNFEAGIKPEAIVGVLLRPPDQGGGITRDNFARNSVFVAFLHRVIAEHGPSVPGLVAEAKRQVEGWVYVIDGRAGTPHDAVPAADIMGAFQVRGGEVVPGSYEPNGSHLIFSDQGFFRLESELHQKLVAAIVKPA